MPTGNVPPAGESYTADPYRIILACPPDSVLMRLLEWLDPAEFRFVPAENGEKATLLMDNHRTRQLAVDALIVDIELPNSARWVKEIAVNYDHPRILMAVTEDGGKTGDEPEGKMPDMERMNRYFYPVGVAGYVARERLQQEIVPALMNLLPPKVLIADDNALTRSIVAEAFHQEGVRICQADNGKTALEKCRIMNKKGMMYDLCIFDISMGGDTYEGISTLETLIGRPDALGSVPETKALFLSAHGEVHIVKRALEAGALDYVRKEYGFENTLLERARAAFPSKVLIVDDSKLHRDILRSFLEEEFQVTVGRRKVKSRYHIFEAGGGREAVEIFKAVRPSAVILDVEMPEMGGIEALRIIRQFEKSQSGSRAVIFMHTTKDSRETVDDAIKAGIDGYIIKGSIDGEKLREKLNVKLVK